MDTGGRSLALAPPATVRAASGGFEPAAPTTATTSKRQGLLPAMRGEGVWRADEGRTDHCVLKITLISVRRFNCRPASVALFATGFAEPRPIVWNRLGSMFGNVLTM